MFWGLVLEPGKRYSTVVDKSFHVSMAALDCSSVKSDSEILSVILESDGQENILCNLSKQQRLLQSHLDLNFMTGDKVAFEIKGNGIVHLSGYLVLEDDDDDDYMNMPDYEDDIEDGEEEESEESPKKNKGKQKGKRKSEPPQLNESKVKKLKTEEDSDDDSDEEDEDDDDDDEEGSTADGVPGIDSSDEDEEEEDDDDSGEEEDDDSDEDEEMAESDEEEIQMQPKKQQKTPQSTNKKTQQTPNKQTPGNKLQQQQSANKQQQQQSANKQNSTTPLVNGSGPNQQQSNKKNKKKGNQGQESPKTPIQNDAKGNKQKTPGSDAGTPQQKKKLEGGVMVKDLKEGTGPIAKPGQMVSVFYQGRLKANNKMFDECKRGGPAFKFRLGKGEVIKGWDIGVNGMKVGGTRIITCPPNMAYGQKGSPPTIPPNSTLVFQVELKAAN